MGTAFEFSMGTVFSFYEDYVYATHNMPSRENGKLDDANSIPSRKFLTIIENVYATGPRAPFSDRLSSVTMFLRFPISSINGESRFILMPTTRKFTFRLNLALTKI